LKKFIVIISGELKRNYPEIKGNLYADNNDLCRKKTKDRLISKGSKIPFTIGEKQVQLLLNKYFK
jgi:hypothetical protein